MNFESLILRGFLILLIRLIFGGFFGSGVFGLPDGPLLLHVLVSSRSLIFVDDELFSLGCVESRDVDA